MQITFLKGYPDYVGKRFTWAGFGNGPAAYTPLTGDVIQFPRYNNYVDAVCGAVTQSGNYVVMGFPTNAGPRAIWSLLWLYSGAQGVSSIAIATAGSGQNNGTYSIAATGGGGTGAVAQIVIAGGAITSATLTSAGRGYTSAPAFTVAQGGTPGTLTSTAAPASGSVPSGTNLSAEIVQIAGLGGVY